MTNALEIRTYSIEEQTRPDEFEYVLPKQFPSGEAIRAIRENRACLKIPSPGFVIQILDAWGRFLRREGQTEAEARFTCQTLREEAFFGLMQSASEIERRKASRSLEEPVITLAPSFTGNGELVSLPSPDNFLQQNS